MVKKKVVEKPLSSRRAMVERDHKDLTIAGQCKLLGIHRSGFYYTPRKESALNLVLMREIDEHFLRYPFIGSRRMAQWLKHKGFKVNRKRIQRLYRLMGLETIYPKPDLSKADPASYKYPFLLKGLKIKRVNQVWATDITYLPMKKGFMYLCAIIGLHSRFVVNWSVSNTMSAEWVCETLREAITRYGKPEILNINTGAQFTSQAYIDLLKGEQIQISMDGKGRATDNIFIERLWRSLKYEHLYLNPAEDGLALYQGLKQWFDFYNDHRHHQSIQYQTPAQRYLAKAA